VHVVPLSPQALAVLDVAKRLPNASEDGFVFPSPTGPLAHLDPHAMTRAVNGSARAEAAARVAA